MFKHITIRWPALCAGIMATAGAGVILLQDVRATGVWQTEHILIAILLPVQVLTAHNVGDAWRARRFDSCVLFFGLTMLLTFCMLQLSVAKQTDVTAKATAAYEHVVAERAKIEPRLAANLAMLATAQAALAKEAGSGCSKICEGKKVSVQVYKDAVAGNNAELAALGPAVDPKAGARAMAQVIVALIGGDENELTKTLTVTRPFLMASAFEGVALASFGFAFVRRRQHLPANDTAPATNAGNDSQGPTPGPSGGGKRAGKRALPANVVSFADHPVRQALTKVDGPVSNNELANLMGVCPGEASKRWREIEPDLHVTRAGRELRIQLRKG